MANTSPYTEPRTIWSVCAHSKITRRPLYTKQQLESGHGLRVANKRRVARDPEQQENPDGGGAAFCCCLTLRGPSKPASSTGSAEHHPSRQTVDVVFGWCPRCELYYRPAALRNEAIVLNYWAFKNARRMSRPADSSKIPGSALLDPATRGGGGAHSGDRARRLENVALLAVLREVLRRQSHTRHSEEALLEMVEHVRSETLRWAAGGGGLMPPQPVRRFTLDDNEPADQGGEDAEQQPRGLAVVDAQPRGQPMMRMPAAPRHQQMIGAPPPWDEHTTLEELVSVSGWDDLPAAPPTAHLASRGGVQQQLIPRKPLPRLAQVNGRDSAKLHKRNGSRPAGANHSSGYFRRSHRRGSSAGVEGELRPGEDDGRAGDVPFMNLPIRVRIDKPLPLLPSSSSVAERPRPVSPLQAHEREHPNGRPDPVSPLQQERATGISGLFADNNSDMSGYTSAYSSSVMYPNSLDNVPTLQSQRRQEHKSRPVQYATGPAWPEIVHRPGPKLPNPIREAAGSANQTTTVDRRLGRVDTGERMDPGYRRPGPPQWYGDGNTSLGEAGHSKRGPWRFS